MKSFLIDGYNLLNSAALQLPTGLDLEARRHFLVSLLSGFAARTHAKITVIFDNREKPSAQVVREKFVNIIFTARGVEADEVILKKIRSGKLTADVTVVTSDNDIRRPAADHGVTRMSSEVFAQLLTNSGKHLAENPAHKSLKQKYEGELGEDQIREWKELFERDDPDE